MPKDILILASQSPRRRELLTQAGIPFEVHVPDVDESCSLPAAEAVAELSRRKALACLPSFSGRFILASDTLVCLDGVSLGKPRDREDAFRMLRSLSGRTHDVFTGVTVLSPGGDAFTGVSSARVTFSDVPDEELRAYVRLDEPLDKAGAYAIQGKAGLWAERLEGSWSAVIGLPLPLVRQLLLQAGYSLVSAWDDQDS